jgi:replicative DNA helicase
MQPKQALQQTEAEMSVLGAVFLENECLKTVSSVLDGQDFHKEAHRKIYHAMLQAQLTDTAIDIVTMSAALKCEGHFEDVGGDGYLYALSEYVPTSANVKHYCKMVKDASVRRQLIAYGQRLIQSAHDGVLEDRLKGAKEELTTIGSSFDSFGGVSLSDLTTFQDRAARYAIQAQKLDQQRFVTGFIRLDSVIRGVAPGEVMTIIAEPGGFKTAWLQNLLMGGAKRTGLHHLFFSLEMPIEKVFEREVQIASGLVGREVEQVYKYADKQRREEAKDLYMKTHSEGSRGLLVCDKPRLDIPKIARYTELAVTKYGKINAVGIDYLGLMHGPGRSLFEKMAHIAPEFKHLAKELNLPVIILCQINREGAKNKHDIEITDAKGGGDIEASADIMLGFYHDAQGKLVCKVLKNRNGANGIKFEAKINKPAFQFQDMLDYEEPIVEKPSGAAVQRRRSTDKTPGYGGLPE